MDIIKIKEHIKEKINNLLSNISVLDRQYIHDNIFIAGGCFKSLILNEKINDYDIYFKSKDSKNKGIGIIKFYFNIKKSTRHAVTITHMSNDFQFITRKTGTPEDITNEFDFEHCRIFYNPLTDYFHVNDSILNSIEKKELEYNGNNSYPISSIVRMQKFIDQGWSINHKNIIDICVRMNDFDLSDPVILKDQISGMYGATGYLRKKTELLNPPPLNNDVLDSISYISNTIMPRVGDTLHIGYQNDLEYARRTLNDLSTPIPSTNVALCDGVEYDIISNSYIFSPGKYIGQNNNDTYYEISTTSNYITCIDNLKKVTRLPNNVDYEYCNSEELFKHKYRFNKKFLIKDTHSMWHIESIGIDRYRNLIEEFIEIDDNIDITTVINFPTYKFQYKFNLPGYYEIFRLNEREVIYIDRIGEIREFTEPLLIKSNAIPF